MLSTVYGLELVVLKYQQAEYILGQRNQNFLKVIFLD